MELQLVSSGVCVQTPQDLFWMVTLLRWSVVWANIITSELVALVFILTSGADFQHDETIAAMLFFDGWIHHCLANWELPCNADPLSWLHHNAVNVDGRIVHVESDVCSANITNKQ
jgi:hypothetical protein